MNIARRGVNPPVPGPPVPNGIARGGNGATVGVLIGLLICCSSSCIRPARRSETSVGLEPGSGLSTGTGGTSGNMISGTTGLLGFLLSLNLLSRSVPMGEAGEYRSDDPPGECVGSIVPGDCAIMSARAPGDAVSLNPLLTGWFIGVDGVFCVVAVVVVCVPDVVLSFFLCGDTCP